MAVLMMPWPMSHMALMAKQFVDFNNVGEHPNPVQNPHRTKGA